MANVDLTPKTYTITNNVPKVEFDCAGMHNGPYAIKEGETPYLDSDITLNMYQTNVQRKIPYGDSITISVITADEAAYYRNACAELGLTLVEVEEVESGSGD